MIIATETQRGKGVARGSPDHPTFLHDHSLPGPWGCHSRSPYSELAPFILISASSSLLNCKFLGDKDHVFLVPYLPGLANRGCPNGCGDPNSLSI